MSLPLTGVRILSVEQYAAGPYGTMLLADLGADVIKIEAPSLGGDVSRSLGPYFLGNQDSQFFQTFSRGKSSVTLELKTPEGRAQFEDLVRGADAVANNLRGDQPEKLGLTFPILRHINHKIVCAHLSGYGRDNSRAAWPGYDYLMQAEAGFMLMTGEPDGPPVRCGLSIIDFHTGTQLATALLAGVIGAMRTGQGCDVDVSLFDTTLHQLSYPATWYLNEGLETARLPRGAHPSIAPSQLVKTADGWLMVMCQTPKFWTLFCALTGLEALAEDPRFATIKDRRAHLEALTAALDARLQTRSTAAWLGLLAGQVPVAPVYSLAQALDNPFVSETAMTDEIDHPDAKSGRLKLLASPFKVNGKRPLGERGPKLGEQG
jgi:crotonobetainyl-CoA:carnitine CoA-transferase CaiB-like acyl-CoA transferase